MKYTAVDKNNPRAMRLQNIGHVLGTPAGEIKKGDTLMWNYGSTELVTDIIKITDKKIYTRFTSGTFTGERVLLKSRLVCILKN